LQSIIAIIGMIDGVELNADRSRELERQNRELKKANEILRLGEAYCLAYYVRLNGGARRLMVTSLRYLDTYVKRDEVWLLAGHQLYVDRQEERAVTVT
jgi:hypothetical protein